MKRRREVKSKVPDLVFDVIRTIIVDFLSPMWLEEIRQLAEPERTREKMRQYQKLFFFSCSWLVPTREQWAVQQARLLAAGVSAIMAYLLKDPYPFLSFSGYTVGYFTRGQRRMRTFPVVPYPHVLSYDNESHFWSGLVQGLKYYLPRVHRYILTTKPLNHPTARSLSYYADVEPTAIVPLVDSIGVAAAASTLDSLTKPALFIFSYEYDTVAWTEIQLLMTAFYHPSPRYWSFKLKALEEDEEAEEDSTRAALCSIVF